MTPPSPRAPVPLVLAAGASTRMGVPKALLRFGGRSALSLIIDSCLLSHNDFGILSSQGGTAVATARVGESVVMSNVTANLSTFGTGQIISQGGNRVGGATGGTTGFTSTEAQQ